MSSTADIARFLNLLGDLRSTFSHAAITHPGITCVLTEYASDSFDQIMTDQYVPSLSLRQRVATSAGLMTYRKSHTSWQSAPPPSHRVMDDGRKVPVYASGGPSVVNIPLRNKRGDTVDPKTLEGRMLEAGSSRKFEVYAESERARDRFMSLANDAGLLLVQWQSQVHPAVAAESLEPAHANGDYDLRWICIVFDLAWADLPRTLLKCDRWAKSGATAATLDCCGHAEQERNSAQKAIIEEVAGIAFPWPPDWYYSQLADMFAASTHAIDLLISHAEIVQSSSANTNNPIQTTESSTNALAPGLAPKYQEMVNVICATYGKARAAHDAESMDMVKLSQAGTIKLDLFKAYDQGARRKEAEFKAWEQAVVEEYSKPVEQRDYDRILFPPAARQSAAISSAAPAKVNHDKMMNGGEPHQRDTVAVIVDGATNGTAETWGDAVSVSITDIARRWPQLQREALRKKLERWRHKNDSNWKEVQNLNPNESRYLYSWGAIKNIVAKMNESSVARPAN